MLLKIGEMLEVLFLFMEVNYICTKKYKFSIYDIVLFLIVVFILDCVNCGIIDTFYMTAGYVLLAAYIELKFRVKWKEFLACVFLLLICSCVIELAASVPVYLSGDRISQEMALVVVNIITCFVVFSLGRQGLFYRIFRTLKESSWLFYSIMVCCGLGTVYLVIVLKFTFSLRMTDYLIFGVWTFLICVLTVMWQKSQNEIHIKNKEIELRRSYEEVYQNMVRSIRQKQHQFDNHLIALCGMYKTADTIEELIQMQNVYMGQIQADNRYHKLLSVESPILVGFLYSKFVIAEDEGCHIDYFVNISEHSKHFIPEYRLIEMLGILIDNAIEAVSDKLQKQVYVEIIETQEEIDICVKNRSEYISQSDILKFVKRGYSTKGEDRGFGLATLVSLVEQYEGELLLCNEEKEGENWFTCKIQIKPCVLEAADGK